MNCNLYSPVRYFYNILINSLKLFNRFLSWTKLSSFYIFAAWNRTWIQFFLFSLLFLCKRLCSQGAAETNFVKRWETSTGADSKFILWPGDVLSKLIVDPSRGSVEDAADYESVVFSSSDVEDLVIPLGDIAVEGVLAHLWNVRADR